MSPAVPAAASRWPILVLTDPIYLMSPVEEEKKFPRAFASIGSPTGVPVPKLNEKKGKSV